MEEVITSVKRFKQIEFWGSITAFGLLLFFFITDSLNGDAILAQDNEFMFQEVDRSFNFYRHFFFPQLIKFISIFSAFLFLNFLVVPDLVNKQDIAKNIVFISIAYLAIASILGITDTYMKAYIYAEYTDRDTANQVLFTRSFLYAAWLLFVLALYEMIKFASIYLLTNSEQLQENYKLVNRETIIAFVVWMISLFIVIILRADHFFLAAWTVIVPSAIFFYSFCFHYLIPKSLSKKRAFLTFIFRVILILIAAYLPMTLIFAIFERSDGAFALSFLNLCIQLIVIAPATWILFKQKKGNEELYSLKKELGSSNANLNFLRSQINPHFLFNALNTIYGTALQEKAERTSEGIEKLGDMMRFMLQENMQEKISLVREVEYLNNYVALQKLRTDTDPNIRIEANLQQDVPLIQIAPMLLIPFVENAFKHGISFREPSYIKIGLEVKNSHLYFDVYNSKHVRPENDPEKDKSGIGLNNVKQRLQLLYANKQELIVRETGREFFVHLTIQL